MAREFVGKPGETADRMFSAANTIYQCCISNPDAKLGWLEEFSSCFMRKLWWLEMVNFIEVLEDIGILVFWMWI